jgi:hypothetical protein
MFIIIGILISVIGILMIFFNIPFSKTKTEFDMTAKNLIAEAEHHEDIFREEALVTLYV